MSKSISSTWSRNAVVDLIDVYRKRTCLYDFKSSDYHNREKNRNAVQDMVDVVSKYHPEVSAYDCKKKYQSLRSQFRREHAKVCKSIQNGAGTEEVYKPKLWCYELLAFLKDSMQFKIDTCDEEAEEDYIGEYLEDEDEFDVIDPVLKRKLFSKSTPSPEPCPNNVSKRARSLSREKSPETYFMSSVASYLQDKSYAKKEPERDPDTIFGEFVVSRLKLIKPKYRRSLEQQLIELIFKFENIESDSE